MRTRRSIKNNNKKKRHIKVILFFITFFILSGAMIYWLFFSSFFAIKNIEIKIEESKYYNKEEIFKIIQKNLNKNIILINLDKIKKDILGRYPEIRNVEIYKKYSNNIIIKIEKREISAIWCKMIDEVNNQQATNTEELKIIKKIKECFYLDKDGTIFRQSPLVKGSLILNIYDSKKQEANIRDKIISQEIIVFILNLKKELEKNIDYMEIISIEDVRVKLLGSYQIYFNPAYSLDDQINALNLVLEQEIKNDYISLEYIDLRTEGRVYYK